MRAKIYITDYNVGLTFSGITEVSHNHFSLAMKRSAASLAIATSSTVKEKTNKKQKLSDEDQDQGGSDQVEVKDERSKEQRRKDKKVTKLIAKLEVSIILSHLMFKGLIKYVE